MMPGKHFQINAIRIIISFFFCKNRSVLYDVFHKPVQIIMVIKFYLNFTGSVLLLSLIHIYTVSADLPDYIMEKDIVRAALRVAKEVDATDEEWQTFMKMLKERKR